MAKQIKEKSKAITSIDLSPQQIQLISMPTPLEFIKERPGRGGKKVRYVEGGWVNNQLNRIFGVLNWDFEILDEKIEGKQIVVRGRLTILDHAKGYKVGKTRSGGAEMKDGVPLGDSIKSAETDALKKCASMFGIALDVYWQPFDEGEPAKVEIKPKKISDAVKQDLFIKAKNYIENERDVLVLRQLPNRIEQNNEFTVAQKTQLKKLIDDKIAETVKN